MNKRLLIAALVFGLTANVHAAILTFDLAWVGVGNDASASGTLALDDTVFTQPVSGNTAAQIGITAFEITVSGANAGNGTFDLADFGSFIFHTGMPGVVLDLTQDLVGQTAGMGLPWGGSPCNGSGDFNIFRAGGAMGAPNGTQCFQITPAGGDINNDSLVMTRFFPTRNAAVVNIINSLLLE